MLFSMSWKFWAGAKICKYLLLDPGETWKQEPYIQIFASSPRWSLEVGTIHSNIRFFAPVKLRNGDNTFKYLLSRPGGIQKRGQYIQIFASSPRWSLEAGTIHSNIRFFAPVKLRNGDNTFKYLLSRPGTVQMRGQYIQIFAFSPRWNSKAGLIHSNICFLVPVQSRSGLKTFTDRHI